MEDLLLAFELYPEVFARIAMRIPETDPEHTRYIDAPGILAEIKWEIDMLLKLEHSSKDGSFYTAANYKEGVIYLEDTLHPACDHNSDADETDLRSHLTTADMAGILAHAYLVYQKYPVYADFAERCLAVAMPDTAYPHPLQEIAETTEYWRNGRVTYFSLPKHFRRSMQD